MERKLTKKTAQEAVKPVVESPTDESIDRRRFLELSRKYAIVAPPAVGLLIAAPEAKAHCQAGGARGGGTGWVPGSVGG